MEFIWNNKIKIFIGIIILFIFSLFSILNSQIFFDTERIINEISNEEELSKLIDDENLIFFGISTKNELSYKDFQDLKSVHDTIRNFQSVKTVSSIINERKLISAGLFPITSKVLNLKDANSFNKTINTKSF